MKLTWFIESGHHGGEGVVGSSQHVGQETHGENVVLSEFLLLFSLPPTEHWRGGSGGKHSVCKAPGFFLKMIREQNPSYSIQDLICFHKTLAYETKRYHPHSRQVLATILEAYFTGNLEVCFTGQCASQSIKLIPKINNHIILNTSDKQHKRLEMA